MPIIRSDTLTLQVTDADQRAALVDTLALYRRLVRDLMTVAYTHWPQVGACQGNAVVEVIERLIHPTQKRPQVRYTYFAKRYYTFPSYLRRVAIMDAVGQVRSFVTRFEAWRSGDRQYPHAKPPRLTCSTKTFPSLYGNQCAKINADASHSFIKVRQHNDWVWMGFRLKGTCRFRGKGKAKSPLLTCHGRQWKLSLPEQFDPPSFTKSAPDRVLAVDVGINTAATWAVVDAQGTVHARGFISRTDKDREYRLMSRIRHAARKQTRHGSRLPPGFCRRDHQRLTDLADNQAHQISRQMVDLALDHGCQAIAVEDLKGWRPKAGKKRTPMKARFHRWFHRQLVTRIESKAVEVGLRFVVVYARGTSRQAFDGSGRVKRDEDNYSRCEFKSGKRYHADLNAAYNIAARGHVFFQGRGRKANARVISQKPNHAPRTPVTLSTLWSKSV